MKIKLIPICFVLFITGCNQAEQKASAIYTITCIVEDHIVTSCHGETYLGTVELPSFIHDVQHQIGK